MSKFSNKETFKDNTEVYALLTELDDACNSTDILAPIKVQVLLDKLKKLSISFKEEKEKAITSRKSLTPSTESTIIN